MKKTCVLMLSLILMFAGLLVLPGCSSNNQAVLNIYNWAEFINPDLLEKFEDETGIKVNMDLFETNEHMLAKLEAGGTNYDLIFPSDYVIEEMIKKDLLQKIDFSNIPNYKYVNDRFKNLEYDPNSEYSVPYFWGTLGILYNTDMVNEEVDSWDILWDEKYAGKILMLDSMRDTIGVALKKLGYSLNTTNPDELEEAKNLLIQQRPLVNGYYVDEIKDMMINGDAAIALNWSGAAMDIYWEGIDNIKYVVPKEGSNLWFDCMVIPKTCQHKKEAEMFINFILDPENAYENSLYVGYVSPVTEAFERLMEEHPEVAEMDAYNPSEEVLDKCEVFVDLGDSRALYNEVWTEVKAH